MTETIDIIEKLIDQVENYSIIIQNYIHNDFSYFDDYQDTEELDIEIVCILNSLFETIKELKELIYEK